MLLTLLRQSLCPIDKTFNTLFCEFVTGAFLKDELSNSLPLRLT